MTPALALLLACAGTKTVESSSAPPTTTPPAIAEVPDAKPTTPAPLPVIAGSRAAPSEAYGPRASTFATKFHTALMEPDQNGATSGISASLAFGMLAEGAGERTRQDWEAVFGGPLDVIRVDNARAMAAFNDTAGVELAVANGLWPDEGMELQEDVAATLADAYGVTPSPQPFSRDAEAAADALNTWTSDNTRGLITELFKPDQLQGVKLVLANAIGFKGVWKTPFDKAHTVDGPFTTPSGPVDVPMMHQAKAVVPFSGGVGYTAVALPYQGDTLSMVVVLPEEGRTLADAVDGLDPANLAAFVAAPPRPVRLGLPRFSIASDHDLTDKAEALGLSGVLGGGADYSRLNGLAVDKAIQKVVVRVDEEGAEAAAVTAVAMKRSAAAAPPSFIADRPFHFVIWHHETKTPLFIGQVVDPR